MTVDRESLVNEIKRHLPDPIQEEVQIDGSLVLIGGDPGEVIVRLSGSKIAIAEFTVRWDGPYTPVRRAKPLATLNGKNLPIAHTMMLLHMLIKTACEIRRDKYRTCNRCGTVNPPEWMHGESICHSCAEEHLGIVH